MDVIVVGAGVAGLLCAVRLARAGLSVTVLERTGAPGGRAATTDTDGFQLNLGPHALYKAGAAARELRALGVTWSGHDPVLDARLFFRGELRAAPTTARGFFGGGLYDTRGRFQMLGLLRRLLLDDAAALEGVTVEDWFSGLPDPAAQGSARALVRVATYANDPARQSAGAALRQLRRAAKGVEYLDGGWGTLVQGLVTAAESAGVTIRTHADVAELDGTRVRVGDAWLSARSVVVALPLAAARKLLPELPEGEAVRAACLDLALRRGDPPVTSFVLGVDEPFYLSVHSRSARLAPDGGMVLHVARYLAPGETGDAGELEALTERVVPGWREQVVARRWLPALTVASRLSTAGERRPGVRVRPGVWVAGDHVGDEGELVDASAASARAAADDVTAALAGAAAAA